MHPMASASIVSGFATVVIASAGCQGRCEPLSVTAEGLPVKTSQGVAVRIPESQDGGGYIVAVFNHAEIDCRTFVEAAHQKRDDELMLRVYFTRKRRGNVSVNFSNDGGRRLELVREPAKVGDTVEICLKEPSVHSGPMAYQRRRVVVQGLVSGVLCGDQPKTMGTMKGLSRPGA